MPTYDYKCDACGHAFEKFQSITAASLRKCPVCGENRLKRLIGTGAGVIFKGGGFYQTDYRSDSYKAEAKKDSGGEPGKGGQKGGKGEQAKSDAPARTEAKPAEPKPGPKTDGGEPPKKKSA